MSQRESERARAAIQRLATDRFDEQAWRILFAVLWPFAVAVCARLHGGDVEAAQESAQESLIRLARYAPFDKLAELPAIQAYLRAVCRRAVHGYYSSRKAKLTVPIDDAALVASDEPGPEGQTNAGLLFEAIMVELSESDQQLLRMITAGYSLREIASASQVDYGTAGVRVHRLRRRVRKWLGGG